MAWIIIMNQQTDFKLDIITALSSQTGTEWWFTAVIWRVKSELFSRNAQQIDSNIGNVSPSEEVITNNHEPSH